jgi:2-methylcitrate dehydratase
MALADHIAGFVLERNYEDLSETGRQLVKLHLLDSIGCAIGALNGAPVHKIRDQVNMFGGNEMCSMIGNGKTSVDRAAMFNTVLTRYLDFMDNFLANGETCHPSDNIGSVLAAAEYAGSTGKDIITAIAIAYQVQCRITEEAPIMRNGFDHTTQLAISIPSVVSRLIGSDAEQTANAICMCTSEFGSLAVIRADPVSQWKGLASSNTAFGCTRIAFLAKEGITGPKYVFEGEGGFFDALDKKYTIDWRTEDIDIINRTLIKKYNAEVHSQSCLEGVLELRNENQLNPQEVDSVHIDIFKTAYDIIGGGKYGSKKEISLKEHADHSLPYLVAVALIDGEVDPPQFETSRIQKNDVQQLLQRVFVDQAWNYTHQYPENMGCHITIRMKDGTVYKKQKMDYYGFWKRPMTWESVAGKYYKLCENIPDKNILKEIEDMIFGLENTSARSFMNLLREVRGIPGDYGEK